MSAWRVWCSIPCEGAVTIETVACSVICSCVDIETFGPIITQDSTALWCEEGNLISAWCMVVGSRLAG